MEYVKHLIEEDRDKILQLGADERAVIRRLIVFKMTESCKKGAAKRASAKATMYESLQFSFLKGVAGE